MKRGDFWKTWANDGVRTLNSFVGLGNGGAKELPTSTSAAQRQALEFIGEAYSAVGPPPSMPAAAAFSELCGARAGYGMPDLLAARANYKAGHTSLSPTHSQLAEAERLLDGADLDAWVNWEQIPLRSPAELAEARRTEPDPEPFTDYACVSSPRTYASFLADFS